MPNDIDKQPELQAKPEMQAEPAVYIDGKVSDESEHAEMLDNPYANHLADMAAVKWAREQGLAEDQIAALLPQP